MATRGLDPHQLEAWVLLNAFFETTQPAIEAELKHDAGINLFEYTVLAMLSEEPDRTLPMSQLADISFGSISRLSHAVGRLEKRGWVAKQSGATGRRHNTVFLTDEGFAALRSAAGPHIATVRRLVIDPLTATELRTFTTVLRKLVGTADPELIDLLDSAIPTVVERNRSAAPLAEHD